MSTTGGDVGPDCHGWTSIPGGSDSTQGTFTLYLSPCSGDSMDARNPWRHLSLPPQVGAAPASQTVLMRRPQSGKPQYCFEQIVMEADKRVIVYIEYDLSKSLHSAPCVLFLILHAC